MIASASLPSGDSACAEPSPSRTAGDPSSFRAYDGVPRSSPLAALVEEDRARVVRDPGDQGPVEPGEIALLFHARGQRRPSPACALSCESRTRPVRDTSSIVMPPVATARTRTAPDRVAAWTNRLKPIRDAVNQTSRPDFSQQRPRMLAKSPEIFLRPAGLVDEQHVSPVVVGGRMLDERDLVPRRRDSRMAQPPAEA